MTTTDRLVRAYRLLLRAYPSSFRTEYGDDMVALLQDQLRDEPTWRVAGRTAVDLAITVPTNHLEDLMHRSTRPAVPLAYAGLAVAGAAFGVVSGTNVGAFVAGLLLAVVAGTMAVISWRRALPLQGHTVTRHWWTFVVAGAALIAAVRIGAELDADAWFLGVMCVLSAIALIAIGLVLAIVRLATRRPRSLAA